MSRIRKIDVSIFSKYFHFLFKISVEVLMFIKKIHPHAPTDYPFGLTEKFTSESNYLMI